MRGWRLRKLIAEGGEKQELFIRRLFCVDCHRIHHELPDCIVPYKRYYAGTIEAIVSGDSDETPCETGTIRRIKAWWSIMQPYFLNVLKSLSEKFKMTFQAPLAFREIVRAVAGSNNWTFANSICTRSVCMS